MVVPSVVKMVKIQMLPLFFHGIVDSLVQFMDNYLCLLFDNVPEICVVVFPGGGQ